MDPAQPVSSIVTMHELLSRAYGKRRFTLQLMAAFAALALLLAAIGLYGIASYVVNRRVREIGIRLALGATAAQMRVRVLRQGAQWTVIGAGVGLVAGDLLLRWARSDVPGLETPTLWPIVAAVAVLVAAAILACDIPARRAMRVDPLITLKAE
jgi:ABC-type antimicrobial peptide transport system permease subunit